jgi:hypothetical protein
LQLLALERLGELLLKLRVLIVAEIVVFLPMIVLR